MIYILNLVWNYFDVKNGLVVRLVNETNLEIIGFFFKFEYKKNNNYYVTLLINIQKLLQAILSLIIFIIFYKKGIVLFTDYSINIIIIYLSIFFGIFICRLLYLLIYGYYIMTYTEEDGTLFIDGIMFLIQLINFLINTKILYWLLFDLTISLFIQCNIILILDIFMVWMFLVYKNIFDYKISGNGVSTFLSYPWIIIFFSIILILLKVDVEDYLSIFLKDYGFLVVGEKNE